MIVLDEMVVLSKKLRILSLIIFSVISVIIASLSYQASCLGEIITLKSGKEVEGEIIEKTEEYIRLDFSGIALTYYMDQIESIGPSRTKMKAKLDEKSTGTYLIKIYNAHLEAVDRGSWPGIKKFLSAGRIREMERISQQTGGLRGLIRILQSIYPRNIRNIRENISFDRATLSGIGQDMDGESVRVSINFTNEYGQWKIGAVTSQRVDLSE